MKMKIIKAKVAPRRGEAKTRRVAAYCRVSTDSDEQEHSLSVQQQHYASLIRSHEHWTYAGIYADEGITGTMKDRRPEFLKMLSDCEAGHIDLVLTKSISRVARNTVDLLECVRTLKACGVNIVFEKENLTTASQNGEIILTMLASLAQAESESISANVRQGIHYLQQQGLPMICGPRFLGYDCPEPHKLAINPEQAKLVRRIFRLYLEGCSPSLIASRLTEEGAQGVTPGGKWYPTTIQYILKNEKYCGDLLIQKYYIADVLTHRQVKNDGKYPQFFIEDNHEPIVPRELFLAVQGEGRRRSEYNIRNMGKLKLECGSCGKAYRMDGSVWRSQKKAPCGCRKLQKAEIAEAVETAVAQIDTESIRRDVLLRKEKIAHIDGLIAASDEHQTILEERLENEVSENEREFLQKQIDREIRSRDSLFAERAELSLREVHGQIFLHRGEGSDDGKVCREEDDFYARTAQPIEPDRMVERIKVFPDRIEVAFLMGVSISVNESGGQVP